MKKMVLATLFLTFFSIMYGQSWHPFPGDQISYFKHPVLDYESKEVLLVERYCNDSLWIESEQQYVHYLSGNTLREECYWQDLQLQPLLEGSGLLNFGFCKADKFINQHDSVLLPVYEYLAMDTIGTIVFKPWVKAGESWVTNGRKIKCTVAGITTILGIQDSIKYFDCELADNTKSIFILSKNHGLIKFMPFNLILNTKFEYKSYIELIGYEKGTQKAGYQLPEFSDYFHLNAGDVLFWKDFAWVGQDPESGYNIYETLYHKDSITSVEAKTDTIIYHYKRWCFDSDKRFIRTESAMDVFSMSNEGNLVDHQPGWFGIHQDKEIWKDRLQLCAYPQTEIVCNYDDTITKITCYVEPLFLDSVRCSISMVMDLPREEIHFSTKEGITRKPLGYIQEGDPFIDIKITGTEVIGSIINGEISGYVLKSTSNKELSKPELHLWPNPVEDILHIDNKGKNISSVELYNISGRLIKKAGSVNHIRINDIPSGVYLLRVRGEGDYFKNERITKK